jgi:hypothetical protein
LATNTPCIDDGSSCTAAVDLTNAQYLCVQITGPRQVNIMTASTGQVFYGVLQNKPKLGQACDTTIFGLTKLIAGGPITAGQQLMPNNSGQAVAWMSGNLLIGVAIESAAANTVFTALVVSALN